MPILPMVLVNGSEGIGTGWSSSVPTYNPRDIVANLKRKINGDAMVNMTPWYKGFKVKLNLIPGTVQLTAKLTAKLTLQLTVQLTVKLTARLIAKLIAKLTVKLSVQLTVEICM
jgi:DNA topoisomerase II